ncbi:MAG: hypothetical protein IKQ06_04680 [Bacilli bacterium]|nr:hypothetical protein [Bacilli bacterium]MBR6137433.1 hypothetical protein [Bacilli bacterium]
MEEENKKNRQTIIIVTILCACLFGLAIAYAALSATLQITFGNVTQNALSWNVGFEPGTVQGTKTGTNTVCGEATATASTVSIANTTLTTLHDKCVYHFVVKNTGTVDALLSSISAKTPSSVSCDTSETSQMVCANITYRLTSDSAGLSLLGANNTLVANTGTLDVYLTAEYTGTSTGGASSQNSGGFTLNYTQK